MFARPEWLVQALTHKSFSREMVLAEGEAAPVYNEQLEFLGDAVLGFAVSARLVKLFPAAAEGRLSKIKARLVSAAHLYSVAQGLDLGSQLILGRGEESSGGRAKRALLVDSLEALIAALYLDGGVTAAEAFVERFVIGDGLAQGLDAFQVEDHKSALQEYAQAHGLAQPRYRVADERGPGHRKVFVVEVYVGDQAIAKDEGPAKKMAEQAAARTALTALRKQDE